MLRHGSTLFLRVTVIVLGLPILALCVYWLPQIAGRAIAEAQKGAELGYMVCGLLALMYAAAFPFYFALFQALKLLRYIDGNEAFSMLSVIALKKIKFCALAISGLYVIALPLIYVVAQWDDAPGLMLIGMVIVGASLVIAVFAAVLQRLLKEAIDIKAENDLTV